MYFNKLRYYYKLKHYGVEINLRLNDFITTAII